MIYLNSVGTDAQLPNTKTFQVLPDNARHLTIYQPCKPSYYISCLKICEV